MGLLTDTSGQGSIAYLIKNHSSKLSVLSYFAGIIWFGLLAWEPYNARTYFSENALLPGLVQREFQLGGVASQVYEALKVEADKQTGIPYSYLQAQFRQLGLELYVHNFTLNYPFGSKSQYEGNNLYAILRAPRSGSLEAIVLSTPYRDASSVHGSTLPSIALMLSLAKFFRQQVYWAKDIIFLITEHELVGFQAWLEAYHKGASSEVSGSVLECGQLWGRSGAIQAAINLEIPSDRISHFDVCLEGLNGQLPNLDLFNLLIEMCIRESVIATFHNKPNPVESESFDGWKEAFTTILSMMATQSTGAPSGAHGLFHRYAIQALTLKGHASGFDLPKATFTQMGRVIEGTFRSLNNLLERFHQSFFFYLLPTSRRYISIGLYIPAFALVAGPVLLQALSLYLNLEQESTKSDPQNTKMSASLWSALPTVMMSHCLGYAMCRLPELFDYLNTYWAAAFKETLYYGILSFLFAVAFLPILPLSYRKINPTEMEAYKCVALLSLGAFLYTLALVNISLAIFLAVCFVPLATTTSTFKWRIMRFLHSCLLLAVQPFTLTYLVILVYSVVNTPDLVPWTAHFKQALSGHQNLLLWNVEDWYLYSSYNFVGISTVFIPVWLQFWYLPARK